MSRVQLEVFIVTEMLGGGVWLYTNKQDAEDAANSIVKEALGEYDKTGRKSKIEKVGNDTRIVSIDDGHLRDRISVRTPMNGRLNFVTHDGCEFGRYITTDEMSVKSGTCNQVDISLKKKA